MEPEFKNYRKKNVQQMRPYVAGEDMTGISVSAEDTPEVGGMIAVNADNPEDKLYVAKEFFESNYILADATESAPMSFQDRVIAEKADLDEKLSKLCQFYDTDIFNGLPIAEQFRLRSQADIMAEYSQILGDRIAAFK